MTPKLKVSGVIHTIFPPETHGSFSKTIVWVEELNPAHENLKNHYSLEFHRDDAKALKKFVEGDAAIFTVEVRGRILNGKNGKGQFVMHTLKVVEIEPI